MPFWVFGPINKKSTWRCSRPRVPGLAGGQEMGLRPENLKPEGGAAVAQEMAKKLSAKAGRSGGLRAFGWAPGSLGWLKSCFFSRGFQALGF